MKDSENLYLYFVFTQE